MKSGSDFLSGDLTVYLRPIALTRGKLSRMRGILWALAFVLATSVVALGQSQNGSISGIVTDQSGAVVANAKVTVTNVATGAVRTTTTTSAGDYTIQGLTPQDYKVSVTGQGFGTTESTLNVSVGSANTVNVKLAVKSTIVEIDVAANSFSGINLENAENSQVINTNQILEFPTETRDPYSLTAMSGSVSSDPSAASRGVGYNINGARSASTEILLDGVENTYLFSVSVATVIPLDAVQEFRIITSNYGPEYGRASGGVVNLVTKTGTNAFHGTAYEFYRPSTFASNSYDNNGRSIPQHRFVRNNFGFSIGGPIKRDKLFFFNNTEWLRVRSSNVVQYYIPTSQLINVSNANTQAFFSKFGTVTAKPTGKVLNLFQIGCAASATATATCPANSTGVSSFFAVDRTNLEKNYPTVFNDNFPMLQEVSVTVPRDAGGGIPQDTYNTIGRVDFNLSDRTQMYGRYVLYNRAYPVGAGNNSPYAGYNTGEVLKAQNLVYGLTHTFSPRLTSQLQIGLLRVNDNQPLGANPAGPTMFINSGSAPPIGGDLFVFPGYNANNAGNGLPSGGPQNNITISPFLTYTKGAHSFTFGGQYTYIRDNHTFAIYENAQEALVSSGAADTINGAKVGALTNFYNGVFDYFQANLDPQGKYPCANDLTSGQQIATPACTLTTPISQPNFSRSNRYHEGAGFFNDSWKVTHRLTLNAGIRYELYGTQHNKNAALDSNFYWGTTGTIWDRIRAGKILRVNDPAPAGVQNPGGKLWNTNYKQFAPRLAFAYDVTGDGKTSLRGGYGMSYERNFGNVTYNVALNPPAQLAASITNFDVGGPMPINTGVLGQFSGGSGVQKAIPVGTVRAVDPKIKPAYNQFYTLALERQVNSTISAGASYTGERGIHNYSIANYNRTYYGQVYENDPAQYVPCSSPGKCPNTNRLNPQYTSINVRGADGDSYYQGVNFFVRGGNLFHQGITLSTNYTYAHSTDNTSSAFTDGQSNADVGGVAYFDPYNHAVDRGNSDFDVKHRISVAVLWAIPYADHTSGLTRAALGGWELGGLFSAATGTPFTMYDCSQPKTTACARVRFLQIPPYQRTGDSKPTGSPNVFDYIDLPGPYGSYKDPKIGQADLPTIVGGIDTFPGGMTARNAFRGPGAMSFDMDANKKIQFNERYALQLRCEVYNVLNHANSYLNLSGANDVSNTPYAQVYKNGPGQGHNRQLQLAAKFIF